MRAQMNRSRSDLPARRRATSALGRRGSVALTVAIVMAVLIGMAALGVEITYVLLRHRQMQAAADSGAIAAAAALGAGNAAGMAAEAGGVIAQAGFVPGTDGVTVAIHNPPASGVNAGNASAVEVVLGQPQMLNLVQMFRSGQFDVNVRAVAIAGNANSACVLQLDKTAPGGFTMSNGATANLVQCGLIVDSKDLAGLTMSGAALLTAKSVVVSGGASITNGASISPPSALKTQQPYVADPYAGVARPAYSGCGKGTNKSYGHGTWALTPGVYCKGIAFTNDAVVTMASGVYTVDRGTFDVGGAVRLTGLNVTIVLTSSTGSSYATVVISNGANVTLTAPTSGATAGIVFFGDRAAPKTTTANFGGGAAINLNGAIYVPTQKLIFQNGISNPSGCTQLIAGTIQLVGGSRFQNNCPAGVKPVGGSTSTLVE
jgi:hypothetical protein